MFKLFPLLFLAVALVHSSPTGVSIGDSRSAEDLKLLLDDIKFPPDFDINAGVIDERLRWPNRQLIYYLDPAFSQSEISIINQGMQAISSQTCISFVPWNNHADYVYIIRGGPNAGCNSYVGRLGGQQPLNLQAPNGGAGHCIHVGTVAHELIHAIGYYHEQSRTDRDDYVEILWDNIIAEYQFAYDKYPATMIDPFGVPYDHQSIMHYKDGGFAIDPSKSTIVSKPAGITLGGDSLTQYDIQKINNMYKC